MSVLLINQAPVTSKSAGYYQRFLAPMPPITLGYLAAALEEAGLPVSIYEDALAGGDDAAIEAALRAERPEVVGLSVITPTARSAERVVRMVRRVCPEATVVMGNIHADVFHEELLRAGLADVVVHGEGEETFVELVRALGTANADLTEVKGISLLRDDEVVFTGPRPFRADLDTLPFPAWHLFPMERYRLFNFARVEEPGTLVLGSRGCPFGCTYCSLKIMGKKRRRRSAANIAEEFEYLHDRFGIKQPSFVDPIFPISKAEGLEFAEELMRRGLHRKQVWITETRTDLVDRELIGALAEAGLRRIMFGFEAGESEALENVDKGVAVDESFRAVAAAKDAGVQIIGFFMLGMPGSTRRSMEKTIELACKLDIDFAKFTVFVPFPGTPVYQQLMAAGKLDDHTAWERYTSYPTAETPTIHIPEGLTNEDLIVYQRRAHTAFYLRPRMMWHHLTKVRTLGAVEALNGALMLAGAFRSFDLPALASSGRGALGLLRRGVGR